MARRLYATAPDGSTVHTTTDRDYRWIVLASRQGTDDWGRFSAHAGRDAAGKSVDKARRLGYRAVVAPARETPNIPDPEEPLVSGTPLL